MSKIKTCLYLDPAEICLPGTLAEMPQAILCVHRKVPAARFAIVEMESDGKQSLGPGCRHYDALLQWNAGQLSDEVNMYLPT